MYIKERSISMNKKIYATPTLETTLLTNSDILAQSDLLIDGSELFASDND